MAFKMAIAGKGRGKGRGAGLAAFEDEPSPKKRLLKLEKSPPRNGNGAEPEPSKAEAKEPSASEPQLDALDAFMEKIDAKAAEPGDDDAFAKKAMASWDDMPAEDPVASYCELCDQNASKGDEDEEDEENQDRRRKPIEPLPRVNHEEIEYLEVEFGFYKPHPEIELLSDEEIASLRKEMRVAATGSHCPRPVVSFAHLRLPKELLEGIRKNGYSKPTPIQSQACPAGLSGRDVIGIAETGSGKTVAYLLPMLVHCAAQPELKKDEGPIGLALCPTRELAVQIEKEVYKFNKLLGLRSTTFAGGLSKYQQFRAIKGGSEIVIATPGRLIDIVKMKGCNLQRCTFLVLDEADRMLQMGFEDQIRSVLQNVRPKRQALLFSATMPPRIERLAADFLNQPVRITVGTAGQAAANVKQHVEVFDTEEEKFPWLKTRVAAMLSKGQVVVFAKSKQAAQDLQKKFADVQRDAAVLHGDLEQDERMRVIDGFRKLRQNLLIATDVAARGLDITTISTVVSFDVARDIETHTHRVGRTGRAGAAGEAFALLSTEAKKGKGEANPKRMAALLVEHLEDVAQKPSAKLLAVAMDFHPFKAARAAGLRLEDVAVEKGKGKGKAKKGKAKEDTEGERDRSRSRPPE
ncbi:unnamed protein product [Effrenium voratum]|uniref:RNA helicase n=1 Tax=Effrenium voratum TaxID=2562239 RepID=A0AA36IYW9_9DINO|nr:unnamed protein product [Effrenium voratum]CAJ1396044.1 unnamed protein product [Effrenium voratum]CAJ1450187.1 unnamed protein product [Effrenium voratum]